MAPRRVFLGLLLLVLAVFTANVSAQGATTTTVTTTTNSTAAPSFCELCRDKGNCAQAYKGGPGIFCGAWLNAASQRMACCCPSNGQCAKTPSNYECMCQSGGSKPSSPSASKTESSSSSSSKKWLYIGAGVVAFCVAAAACFFCCTRNDDYGADVPRTVVVQQPVYAQAPPPQPMYGAQPVAYGAQPMYGAHPQPMYGGGGYGQQGYSGGTVAAAAVGGAAVGLVGGMVVGEMIADAGHHGDYSNYSSGGGGGYDNGGAFAGDF